MEDLTTAKLRCASLVGDEPHMDDGYDVGFRIAGQEVGLDPYGYASDMTGPVAYWHLVDINQSVEAHPINDVGGGKMVADRKDADGDILGFLQEPVAMGAG